MEVRLTRPLRVELEGAVYHVIARGNERKAIFRDDHDRTAYLDRLAYCSRRYRLKLIAYCLMSNHVHLALRRGPDRLSGAMLALQSFYAQRFNRRHERVGHLFQGRYKALLIQDDRYLFDLLRYIHLNPVRAGLSDRPEAYRWSSDRFYRRGSGPTWMDLDFALRRLGSTRAGARATYRRMMAGIEESNYEELPTYFGTIRGDRQFARGSLWAIGEPFRMPGRFAPADVAAFVARSHGLSLERMKRPGKSLRESRARLTAAYLGRTEAGIPVAQMARCLGREESTFNRGVRRLEELMRRDPVIRARVSNLATRLRPHNTGIHD